MITVEHARQIILNRISPLSSEKVFIEQALGRYLAEDIVSARDIPPWDNSAMDGYAVHAADIVNGETRLEIAYEIPAGGLPKGPFSKGTAVKIMTGAPLPPGADAVIKREDTLETEGAVVISRPPKTNENIRFRGEDIRKGDAILSKNSYLGPAQIGLLASVRRTMVFCHQRPLIAVLATGDEVADIDEELSGNKISSSNSFTLKSLITELGAIPLYLGIAKDTKKDLVEKFSMAKKADLILTSGGVSMGDYDIVREVMTEGPNDMTFWKVDIKPGRPLAFGEISGVPAIGLPGNPLSTMTAFYQFARPAILKLMGSQNLLLPKLSARLSCTVKSSGDRPHYMSGVLENRGGDLIASPAGPQGSGMLSSIARANCYLIIPKGRLTVEQGEYIDCEIFRPLWTA